jgi:hypothetical protein
VGSKGQRRLDPGKFVAPSAPEAHEYFENLMPESLVSHVVDCINTGRIC